MCACWHLSGSWIHSSGRESSPLMRECPFFVFQAANTPTGAFSMRPAVPHLLTRYSRRMLAFFEKSRFIQDPNAFFFSELFQDPPDVLLPDRLFLPNRSPKEGLKAIRRGSTHRFTE